MQDKIDKCLEGIHRIEIALTEMRITVKNNTDDIAEHIRRTNLLEKKLSKVYMAVLVGAGFAAAHFGPDILKLLKVVAL